MTGKAGDIQPEERVEGFGPKQILTAPGNRPRAGADTGGDRWWNAPPDRSGLLGPMLRDSAERREFSPQAPDRHVCREWIRPTSFFSSALTNKDCQIFLQLFFVFLFTQMNGAATSRVLSSAWGRRFCKRARFERWRFIYEFHWTHVRQTHLPLGLSFSMK